MHSRGAGFRPALFEPRPRLRFGGRARQGPFTTRRTSQTTPGSRRGEEHAGKLENTITTKNTEGLPRALLFRRGCAQEIYKHVVKLFGVQIDLYFDRLDFDYRL